MSGVNPKHPSPNNDSLSLAIEVERGKGVLHQITSVILRHGGDITAVAILDAGKEVETLSFEIADLADHDGLVADLRSQSNVRSVDESRALKQVFGKRVIIIGGGAQVGQVAIGAVSEADRHNLRGERISVDTIPLVGEAALAEAVRATARLPRVRAVVLAGALMGGDIEVAVREVRERGLIVISLNMAGSVPDSADLVVSDPVQAGVMAVMAVSDNAKFNIARLSKRRF
jgi:energy-converting hydrogenase B subunit Q